MRKIGTLFIATFFSLVCVIVAVAASADEIANEDAAAFQEIITSQIKAFQVDNADAAFAFATPKLQEIFRSPENFISMVKQGYAPVYRPKSFEFGPAELKNGQPTQIVTIVGPKGTLWAALYTFEQQSNGNWRISGVYLVKRPGAAT
ncbi:DUF4864 domain-containing protein [Sneathiella marina]|uniref:DUF4864 domain-containing protein n=1 Tax=Sneathiella marina TaxID=2950108 RepID=A0ABY4W3S9_9PROT|nr:DUF4864 domain-containing protein [Sneathiella marina]USG61843.1 DUF4864 domain-containing protein [Sneathiella marina]